MNDHCVTVVQCLFNLLARPTGAEPFVKLSHGRSEKSGCPDIRNVQDRQINNQRHLYIVDVEALTLPTTNLLTDP